MLSRLHLMSVAMLVSSGAMAAETRPGPLPAVILAVRTPEAGGYWMPGHGSDPTRCDLQPGTVKAECVVDFRKEGAAAGGNVIAVGASFKLVSVSRSAVVFDVDSGPEKSDAVATYTSGRDTIELPRVTMLEVTHERVTVALEQATGRASLVMWGGTKVEFDVGEAPG